MKHLIHTLSLLLATHAIAQVEIAPREDTQKAALQLNNAVGQPADLPFKLETDILNAFALNAGEVAMLAVPVHSLKQKIESAKENELIPAGQLWLHKIVPDLEGKPVATDRLRQVEVAADNETTSVTLLHLAIRKHATQPELLIYGAGKEPFQKIPLKKMTVPQEAPIELDGRKRDEASGELSIYLGDHYEAQMILRPRKPSE